MRIRHDKKNEPSQTRPNRVSHPRFKNTTPTGDMCAATSRQKSISKAARNENAQINAVNFVKRNIEFLVLLAYFSEQPPRNTIPLTILSRVVSARLEPVLAIVSKMLPTRSSRRFCATNYDGVFVARGWND